VPLAAKLNAVTVSGTDQVLGEIELRGARVQSVFFQSGPSSPALGKVAVIVEPEAGLGGSELANLSAVPATGGTGRIDVGAAVQWLRVTATRGAGGNGVLTVWVTSALSADL
jgi:hypothetical protein